MDEATKKQVYEANTSFASNGRRVLAFAYYEVAHDQETTFFKEHKQDDGKSKWKSEIALDGKLVLAGLFGIEDPARVEVPPAVKSCHSAGVRVIMVTGDHSLTAQAIAKDIGILNADPAFEHLNKVVSGNEISDYLASKRADPSIKQDQVEQEVINWVQTFVDKYP